LAIARDKDLQWKLRNEGLRPGAKAALLVTLHEDNKAGYYSEAMVIENFAFQRAKVKGQGSLK
jgi:hypothetical protein